MDAQTTLYDPAWYDDGSLETDEQWALVEGHAVLFYAWAVRQRLVPDEFPHTLGNRSVVLPNGRTAEESADEAYRRTLKAIRDRDPSALVGAVWVIENGMTTRDFSPEGASFATACFSAYRDEYPERLGLTGGSGIEATWERFDEIAPLLDALLERHEASGCA